MIHIVLYQPEIPQNTGNIMRTCVATNATLHLIKPYGFMLDEKNIRRSGMDYRKDLNLYEHESWEDFTNSFPANYFYVTRYANHTHSEANFNTDEDIFLVFGKESTGIPKEILKEKLDRCIRIPMVATARSLNLSNSVGIVLYEALRQIDYPKLSKHEVIKGEDWLVK